MRHPNGYWNNKDICLKVAILCKNKIEFQKFFRSAYKSAIRNKWLDEICSHMKEIKKTKNFWNDKNNCHEVTLKYNTKKELKENNITVYFKLLEKKWIEELCSHMIELQKPTGYWNDKNLCHKESLKYNTKSDFQKGSRSAYKASLRNDWIDEICSHMEIVGDRFHRIVYSYEFLDNHVYVGLTYKLSERNKSHLNINNKKSSVSLYINNTGLKPTLKILTDGYVDKSKAQILENYFVSKYKKEGWCVLNKIKTGSLGGRNIINTKEKCLIEALKYNSKYEFIKHSKKYYSSAYKNGWLTEICTHMTEIYKPVSYWNFEKCKEEAKKYNCRTNFRKYSSSAYNSALRNKWLDVVCSHMKICQKRKNFWNNKNNCYREALKYDNIKDFRTKSGSAYNSIYRNLWSDELCSHMKKHKKQNGAWNTKSICLKEALKYKYKGDFKKHSSGAYNSALRNKWLDVVCSHMVELHKPINYWILDKCVEEALKYKNKTNFKNNSSGAYRSSLRNGWLDEICFHMK
jgi:hypothetical protein